MSRRAGAPPVDDLTRLEHDAQLALVQAALVQAGRVVRLLSEDDGVPVPTLLVELGRDDANRERTLAVAVMPVGDDRLTSTQLTQFYVPMPFGPGRHRAAVEQATAGVNAAMAVGHFALRDDEIYYRYVLASPRSATVDPELVVELVSILEFHQDDFADYLEGVAAGEIDVRVLPGVIAGSG